MAGLSCRTWWLRLAPLCGLLAACALAGCAWRDEPPRRAIKDSRPRAATASAASTARPTPPRNHGAQAPDTPSCHDIESCEALLRTLVDAPDRSWMRRPATPAE